MPRAACQGLLLEQRASAAGLSARWRGLPIGRTVLILTVLVALIVLVPMMPMMPMMIIGCRVDRAAISAPQTVAGAAPDRMPNRDNRGVRDAAAATHGCSDPGGRGGRYLGSIILYAVPADRPRCRGSISRRPGWHKPRHAFTIQARQRRKERHRAARPSSSGLCRPPTRPSRRAPQRTACRSHCR